jgi:LysM repeat protein
MDYRVLPGDTLSAIAAKFSVSLSALEAANPQITDPNKIFPDELVHVPAPNAPGPGPVQVPPHVVTYVVRPGDTMSGIAAAHNISLAALVAANPQVTNPDVIHPGEVLNLTGGAAGHGGPPMPGPSPEGAIAIGTVTYGMFTGGGGVSSWTAKACEIMHVPSASWVFGYLTLCARESSGQANAINHTDINAHGPIQSDGFPLHCSRGVAQCIPDTFAGNHVPGTSAAIYDPVANIAASMRYVMRRYGVAPDGHNLTLLVQQADINRSPLGY